MYILHKSGIFGGGLYVTAVNIQRMIISTLEGNDIIYVLSSSPAAMMGVVGGLGSDTIIISPRQAPPVISDRGMGHSGIVEHSFISTDPAWQAAQLDGISVNVFDAESLGFKVRNIRPRAADLGTTLLVPDDLPGPIDPDYLSAQFEFRLSNYSQQIEIHFSSLGVLFSPQQIVLNSNSPVAILNVTSRPLGYLLDYFKDNFDTNEAYMAVLASTLDTKKQLPSLSLRLLGTLAFNTTAYSVRLIHPAKELRVLEGDSHYNDTYELIMYPCSKTSTSFARLKAYSSDPYMRIEPSVFTLSPNSPTPCRQTVRVWALDDSSPEGNRYSTVMHYFVEEGTSSDMLHNLTVDDLPFVGVAVYDNDVPGLIVIPPETDYGVIEGSSNTQPYKVKLTMTPPVGGVTLHLHVQPTPTERFTLNTRYEQLSFTAPSTGPVVGVFDRYLTFNSSSPTELSIPLYGLTDHRVESSNVVMFAPQQPLAFNIQGPVIINGEVDASIPDSIPFPFM